VDGRVKPGHDDVCRFLAFLRETSAFSALKSFFNAKVAKKAQVKP
jgi:hypothetical protein